MARLPDDFIILSCIAIAVALWGYIRTNFWDDSTDRNKKGKKNTHDLDYADYLEYLEFKKFKEQQRKNK